MDKSWKVMEILWKTWKNNGKIGKILKNLEISKKFIEKQLKFPRNFYDNYNVLHSSITHNSS